MRDWLIQRQAALGWLAAASVFFFVASIIAVPMVVVRIPADYFAPERLRSRRWSDLPPAMRLALVVSKNVAGCILVAAGLIMLVLPGQGTLTIIAGLMLLDFPGKRDVERWAASRAPVRRAIDGLRVRAGRAPLDFGDRAPSP